MSEVLSELLSVLRLERIEENIFRGPSQDLGWGRVFGGQVLGQALSAAEQTVPEGRHVHSFHSYFLRPGDAKEPIVFTVDPIRDGKSFATRRVVAIQKGKAIFNLSASFQSEEESHEHQDVHMPDVAEPETLKTEQELSQRYIDRLPEQIRAAIPAFLREQAIADRPIEIRIPDPIDPIAPEEREPIRRIWMKANGAMPEDHAIHQYLLAYSSDFHFFVTAFQPHRFGWLTPGYQIASLDHSMYFHRPFKMDEWLLYDTHSPSATGARGLVQGRFFDRQGNLVATAIQEGLMRKK